jgi:hypothetical protein
VRGGSVVRSDQAPLWSNNLPNELSVRIVGSTHAVSENRMIDLIYYYLSMCKRRNAISHATLHGGIVGEARGRGSDVGERARCCVVQCVCRDVRSSRG